MSVKYLRNPQTAGRIIDDQAFVVTPDDNKLHTLNKTATRLWILAGEAEGCTRERGAADLAERFAVEQDRALSDVTACLADLVERRILIEKA